jgi:LemA protein
MPTIIILVVLALLIVFAIGVFNNIVSLENRVENALGQIDVQLKKRSDLVPNLVSTVKGYAAHESTVFEKVTAARAQLDNAKGVEDKAAASSLLSGALRTVFAVAEAYPDLKANQNFIQLQNELSELEDKIAYSRQFYNDTVLEFNNAITTVPGTFFASPMNKTKIHVRGGRGRQSCASREFLDIGLAIVCLGYRLENGLNFLCSRLGLR